MNSVPRLLAITDCRLLSLRRFFSLLELFCKNGLPAIQLRERELRFDLFKKWAEKVVPITKKYETRLYINLGNGPDAADRLRLATDLGATGVQLPEGGLSIQEVREISTTLEIGLSVHQSVLNFLEWDERPDFVVAAPIWIPFDKSRQPLGLNSFSKICENVPAPVIGLGGITPESAREVFQAGGAGVAVRSGLWLAGNPRSSLEAYVRAVEEKTVTDGRPSDITPGVLHESIA